MQITPEYTRDLTHNYMIIRESALPVIEEENDVSPREWQSGYEIKVLMTNRIPGLLPVEMEFLNGKECYLRYDISSMKPFELVCRKGISTGSETDWLRSLYLGLLDLLSELEDYLLPGTHLLLQPDTLYLEWDSGRPAAAYVPFFEKDLKSSLTELTEYLLLQCEHKSQDSVVLLCRLLHILQQGNSNPEELRVLLADRGPSGDSYSGSVFSGGGYPAGDFPTGGSLPGGSFAGGFSAGGPTGGGYSGGGSSGGGSSAGLFRNVSGTAENPSAGSPPGSGSAAGSLRNDRLFDEAFGRDFEGVSGSDSQTKGGRKKLFSGAGKKNGKKTGKKEKKKASEFSERGRSVYRDTESEIEGFLKTKVMPDRGVLKQAAIAAVPAGLFYGFLRLQRYFILNTNETVGAALLLLAAVLLILRIVSGRRNRSWEKTETPAGSGIGFAGAANAETFSRQTWEPGDTHSEYADWAVQPAEPPEVPPYHAFCEQPPLSSSDQQAADLFTDAYGRNSLSGAEEKYGNSGNTGNDLPLTSVLHDDWNGETEILAYGNGRDRNGRALLLPVENGGISENGKLPVILIDREEILIGKSRQLTDIQLPDESVSRLHAKIVRNGNLYYLEDMGSRNGSRINGRMLDSRREYLLTDGDLVSFSRCEYRFSISGLTDGPDSDF